MPSPAPLITTMCQIRDDDYMPQYYPAELSEYEMVRQPLIMLLMLIHYAQPIILNPRSTQLLRCNET